MQLTQAAIIMAGVSKQNSNNFTLRERPTTKKKGDVSTPTQSEIEDKDTATTMFNQTIIHSLSSLLPWLLLLLQWLLFFP